MVDSTTIIKPKWSSNIWRLPPGIETAKASGLISWLWVFEFVYQIGIFAVLKCQHLLHRWLLLGWAYTRSTNDCCSLTDGYTIYGPSQMFNIVVTTLLRPPSAGQLGGLYLSIVKSTFGSSLTLGMDNQIIRVQSILEYLWSWRVSSQVDELGNEIRIQGLSISRPHHYHCFKVRPPAVRSWLRFAI